MTEHTKQGTGSAQGTQGNIRVWDPMVRIFHWSLVAVFTISYLSAEGLDTIHQITGYTVAGLVAFRLIWGLVGGRYARFTQFIKGPAAVMGYLRDMLRGRERRYLGHNPAGAAMILALLVTLAGTAFTGWLLVDPTRVAMLPDLPQFVSPAFADADGAANFGGKILKSSHEVLSNLMLLLIGLHVVGVVFASLRHKENLARAMVKGDKRGPGPDDIA